MIRRPNRSRAFPFAFVFAIHNRLRPRSKTVCRGLSETKKGKRKLGASFPFFIARPKGRFLKPTSDRPWASPMRRLAQEPCARARTNPKPIRVQSCGFASDPPLCSLCSISSCAAWADSKATAGIPRCAFRPSGWPCAQIRPQSRPRYRGARANPRPGTAAPPERRKRHPPAR